MFDTWGDSAALPDTATSFWGTFAFIHFCCDLVPHVGFFFLLFCFFPFLLCCQDLKHKILIKNKKLKARSEAEESVDEGEEEGDDEEEEEEEQQSILKFWSPRKSGSKKKVSESDEDTEVQADKESLGWIDGGIAGRALKRGIAPRCS